MRILATGATGFLGNAFAESALARRAELGVILVRATGRREDHARNLVDAGGEFIAGDLADPEIAARCVAGIDIVVHCAGRSGIGGPMSYYHRANVEASRILLEKARAAGVRRIVNIGTPSIYFDHSDTLARDENYLPSRMPDNYAASKHEAEMELLRANGQGIETISLRPRFVTGRGERNILPRFIRMHREGKFKRIGRGENEVDFTALANMLAAMWLAATAPAPACGEAYNITNGDPVKLWPFLDKLMTKAGLPPVTASVPYPVAYAAGAATEALAALRGAQPTLSRLSVAVMAKSMTMSIEKAKARLGYQPKQTNEQMLDEFVGGPTCRAHG